MLDYALNTNANMVIEWIRHYDIEAFYRTLDDKVGMAFLETWQPSPMTTKKSMVKYLTQMQAHYDAYHKVAGKPQ